MIKKKIKAANTRKIDELNTAIAINDVTAMHEILITNIDVNAPDSRGVYPVMYAVETGNANALISLIKHGANVNVVYKHTGYLNDHQKLEFLSDFYASVEQGDFDEDIINFIAEEKEKAYRRKQESNAKRREKKRATYAMSETRPSNPVQVRFDDTIETKPVYVPRYETL